MLHIVNKSPLERNSLADCLETATPGSLLLIEDAVYAATREHASASLIESAISNGHKVYVLQPDLEARGMAERAMEGVSLVDYEGFVDLVAAEPVCHSWL